MSVLSSYATRALVKVAGVDASGNVGLSGLTQGSVLFAGSGGALSEDNADFFWDDTNRSLFVGGAVPGAYYAYNTFTDGTHFERAVFGWNSTTNTLVLGTEKGSGGGTARNVQFRAGGTDVAYFLGANAGSAFAGDLLWNTDNNNNIGSIGANRPADVYVANGIHVGGSGGGNSIIDGAGRFTSNGSVAGNQSYVNLNNNGADYGSLGNISANLWYLGSSSNGAAMHTVALKWDASGTIYMTTTVVASLPAAGTIGRKSFVTDATATTFASVVAGGGANKVSVYDDGTNWRIG